MPIQGNLFTQPSLNITSDLKRALAEDADQSGLSREQIVDRMNDLAGRYGICLVKGAGRLNLETLNKWLNQAEPQRLPSVKALPVFCAVVKSQGALQVQAAAVGAKVIGEQEIRLLQWAQEYHKSRAARRRMRKLEEEIR